MVERLEPEFKSQWFFDKYADGSNCAKGIGKLCESVTDHGVRRRMAYDLYARPLTTRTDIAAGPSFAAGVSYDALTGRIATQTYPTGLKVRYNHTARGYLSSMSLVQAATLSPLPETSGGAAGAQASLPAGSLLWQALSYSAWGKIEEQRFGNGVQSKASFEALTGRVSRLYTGKAAEADVADYRYEWNAANQLTVRTDAIGDGSTGAITDTFSDYDGVGRLRTYRVATPAHASLERTVQIEYNDLGSVLSQTGVGVYTYPAQKVKNGRPHALQNVTGDLVSAYGYDANGNMISSAGGKYRTVKYTSFNLPDSEEGLVGAPGTAQYRWMYDAAHQRIKEVHTDANGERITWMLHPDAANGLSFESEVAAGITNNRHYLTAGGESIGVLIARGALPALGGSELLPPDLAALSLVKQEYWHKDSLGSLVATTDHDGSVTARYSYDPFGKRRTASGLYDADGALVYDWNNTRSGTDRGYTGHEHLDDVGIVHMNGRLFDPRLGMFMQGDPFIQDPNNLQNYNRYAYCYNNPLTCTDPTGQLSLFGHRILPGLFNSKNIRLVASIAVAWYLGPMGAGWGEWGLMGGLGVENAVARAAISGFMSGAIASGNLKGGLQGAFSTAMFFGAGEVIGNLQWQAPSSIALHAVAGCINSEVGGGKCGAGALSASFSKAISYSGAMRDISRYGELAEVAAASVVGGTASVLGGGKFANGAQTAAFSYIFNQLSHRSLSPDEPVRGGRFGINDADNPLRKLWVFADRLRQWDAVTVSAGFWVLNGQATMTRDYDFFWGPSFGRDFRPSEVKFGWAWDVTLDYIDNGEFMDAETRRNIIGGPSTGIKVCAFVCGGRSWSPDPSGPIGTWSIGGGSSISVGGSAGWTKQINETDTSKKK